jgi:hypothetical protein
MKKHSIKTAVSLEEVGHGKTVPKAGWLKEVWGKWPGYEPNEELLAILKGDGEKNGSAGEKQRRQNSDARKR